jgi:hypothetical protein
MFGENYSPDIFLFQFLFSPFRNTYIEVVEQSLENYIHPYLSTQKHDEGRKRQ